MTQQRRKQNILEVLLVMLLLTVTQHVTLAKKARVLLMPAKQIHHLEGAAGKESIDAVTAAFSNVLMASTDIECQRYYGPIEFDDLSKENEGRWDIVIQPNFDLLNIAETKRLRLRNIRVEMLYMGHGRYLEVFDYSFTGINPFIKAGDLKAAAEESIKGKLDSDIGTFYAQSKHRDSARIIDQLMEEPNPEIVKTLVEEYDALGAEPDANDAQSLATLGSSYYIVQRYDKAAAWLQKAYAIDPSNPKILEPLGNALLQLKERSEALRVFDELYRIVRHRQEPYLPLLKVLIGLSREQNNTSMELDYLRTLTDKQEIPDLPETERIEALLRLYRLGKDSANSDTVKRAVKLISDEAGRGIEDGKYQWSVDLLSSVDQDLTSNAYFLKGLALERLGRDDKANEAFLSASNLDQSNISLYAHIARYYIDKGMKEKLLALYTKAIAANGSLFVLRYGLGVAYLLNDRFDEAITELMAAGSASPELFPLCQRGIAEASYRKAKGLLKPLVQVPLGQLIKEPSSYIERNIEWAGRITAIKERQNVIDLYVSTASAEIIICRIASLPRDMTIGSEIRVIGSLVDFVHFRIPEGRMAHIPVFSATTISGQYHPIISQ